MNSGTTYPSQISLEQALAIIEREAPQGLGLERVRLEHAHGRTLAEDLASLVDHPSSDNSAMDGYACREADTLSATPDAPVRLELIGDIPAGSRFATEVGPGQAVGIYTGASVPRGADAIIMVEKTRREGDFVLLERPATRDDIRPRAQDLVVGRVYLNRGVRLTPAAVGVAAAMGYRHVTVAIPPRIGILSTGDEVIEPGEPLQDGQVYNANAYAVAGLVQQCGGTPVILPKVGDDVTALQAAVAATGGLDLLVTSGGVSMGRYDFVRDLLIEGGTVHFWKVALKPGGPVLFGRWRELSVFGLPGNPVSSMVVFLLLTSRWLGCALGSSETPRYYRRLTATAQTPFRGAGAKVCLNRARLSFDPAAGYLASSTGNQSSGVLSSMLHADALAIVPPEQHIGVGERLEVILL